ncbi:MAG: hypothetical protein PF569_00955 [Candidatus Woesearchaeota archaeon]|jgi:hypothetical protein|nr:hypothetical protein [Candidatus Woesearchaeota archaeon]
MNRVKKAQISIFIIISVILIIGAITIFTYKSNDFVIFSDEKSSYKVEQFVESCIEDQAKAAIKQIGYHGGWLYSKEMIYTDRSMPDVYNKQAEGLNFLERTKMPYWYYYDDSNEEFKFNIPEYDTENEFSIKNQVKRYVEENLERNCLENFQTFENIYEIEYESKDIKDNLFVEFDKDEIIIGLDLPIKIRELASRDSENIDYINFFEVNLENKLYIPYNLALDITVSESKSSFIEHRILSFLNPFMTTENRDMLPPFYDFRVEPDFEVWEVRKVEKITKQIVSSNIGLIQFLNTDFNEYELPSDLDDSEFARGFVSIYTKDYLSENSVVKDVNSKIFHSYSDYTVNPTYEGSLFPTYFRLSPTLGNVILQPKSTSVINFIPIFFTEYNAVYEMTMPVKFEIENSQNPNDDFVFNLIIETNIDYNKPLAENYDATEINTNNLNLNSGGSLICDQSQFISDFVYLNISDPVVYGLRTSDDEPKVGVEDAIVSFDCKGLSKCYITQTQINGVYASDNQSILKFRLPTNCNPGTLEVYKYGHKKLEIPYLDPKVNEPLYLGEYELPSKKKLSIEIKIIGSTESRRSSGRTLTKDETGFIIFSNTDDEDIVEIIEITMENQYDLELELTTGKYDIQGFITYNNQIIIPEENMAGATIPQMNLSSWISGGVEVKDFEVIKTELLGMNTITIYIQEIPIPNSLNSLQTSSEVISNLDTISDKPSFSYEN